MPRLSEEQKIQKKILDFLYKKGFIAAKFNNIGIFSTPGFPDIVCCSPKGRFIAIEVKVPGEKPKPHQQAYIDAINKLNGIAFYATSVNEVENKLKEKALI